MPLVLLSGFNFVTRLEFWVRLGPEILRETLVKHGREYYVGIALDYLFLE